MNYKNGILVLIVIVFGACKYPKYQKSFRVTKKTLDTYVVMEPVVTVYARVKNSITSNPPLSVSTSKIVNQIVNKTLSSKFKLKGDIGVKYNSATLDSVCHLLDNNKSKELKGIAMPSNINVNFIGKPERYGLLISMIGFYNPNFNPHNSLTRGMATNSLIFNFNTKPSIEIRLMVIDFELKELVFYDKFISDNFDPRVETEVAELVKRRLRKIYYK
jgi:hypothetical protein